MLQDSLRVAQTQGGHTAAAIRDTIAQVFTDAAYTRSVERTLGGVLWNWFVRAYEAVVSFFRGSPPAKTVALWIGFGIMALIIARVVYVAMQRGQFSAQRGATRAGSMRTANNPWQAAQRAANEGNYSDAIHHLYAALLQSLAHTERLRLHPSKTAGDYVRDLRARSSPSFTPFRGFVRAFEFVAYGHRACDRAQFEQLRALAEPLVRDKVA